MRWDIMESSLSSKLAVISFIQLNASEVLAFFEVEGFAPQKLQEEILGLLLLLANRTRFRGRGGPTISKRGAAFPIWDASSNRSRTKLRYSPGASWGRFSQVSLEKRNPVVQGSFNQGIFGPIWRNRKCPCTPFSLQNDGGSCGAPARRGQDPWDSSKPMSPCACSGSPSAA